MHWLTLSLICAFTLASSDAAAKYWLRGAGAREMVVVRLGLSGLLLIPWVLTFDLPPLPLPFWGWMALLMPLEIIAMLMYMQAIRDYPLALTVPYLAFTPVLVVVTGWLVLDETVSGPGLVGILLVVGGSWLLNFEQSGTMTWRQLLTPLKAIVVNPGSRLMLATASIYAVTSVGGKAAMQWMPPQQFGAFYFAVLGSCVLLLVAVTRPQALRIRRFGIVPLLIVAGFMALMVVTHFLALAQVEAAYMIAVKRTSLLFGMLYGAMLFGERHLGRHLLAGALMVAGVVAIGL
ncbi:MAG: EamA family transporter [Gammaproteobacteria bacterium]|nr:EamA family transporter [Gammaproteobacteria bacterium]